MSSDNEMEPMQEHSDYEEELAPSPPHPTFTERGNQSNRTNENVRGRLTEVKEHYCFFINTPMWWNKNAIVWKDCTPMTKKFLMVMHLIMKLLNAEKIRPQKKRRPNNQRGNQFVQAVTETDVDPDILDIGGGGVRNGNDEMNQEEERLNDTMTQQIENDRTYPPSFLIQPIPLGTGYVYIVHIFLFKDNQFENGVTNLLDDVSRREWKDLFMERTNSVIDREKRDKFGGLQLANQKNLKDIFKYYLSTLDVETLQEVGLYTYTKGDHQNVPDICSLFTTNVVSGFLSKLKLNPRILEELQVNLVNGIVEYKTGDFIPLESLNLANSDKKLPHCDEKFVKFVETIYDFREKQLIEGELEHALHNDFNQFVETVNIGGVKMYNDFLRLLESYNKTAFGNINELYKSCKTKKDLDRLYVPALQKYFDKKIYILEKVLDTDAPTKVLELRSLSTTALLKWMHVNRAVGDGTYRFFRRKEGSSYVPQNFKKLEPKVGWVGNWILYLLDGVNNVEYSLQQNNNIFLCLYNMVLGQFSSTGGLRLANWVQSPPALSKSFLQASCMVLSPDGTYTLMTDSGSQHKDITQTLRNYTLYWNDEGLALFTSKNGKDSEALAKFKAKLTSGLAEREVMAFSEDKTRRYTIQYLIELLMTIGVNCNYVIAELPFASRFIIHDALPPPNKTDVDESMVAQKFEEFANPTFTKEFKDFNKDVACLCALTNFAITTNTQLSITDFAARIVLLDLANNLKNSNLILTIEKRNITQMSLMAVNYAIVDSWLKTLIGVDEVGNFTYQKIIEAAKQQVTTLETIVLAFTQQFDTFLSPFVNIIFDGLYNKEIDVPNTLDGFYVENFGINYKPVKLNYGHHLLGIAPSRFHSLRTITVVKEKDIKQYIDPNYVSIKFSSYAQVFKKFKSWGLGKYIYTEENFRTFLSDTIPRVKPKVVLKYIDEPTYKISLQNMRNAKKATKKRIARNMESEHYDGKLENLLEDVTQEYTGIFKALADNNSFHEEVHNDVYRSSQGLPIILIEQSKGKSKDAVVVSFLIEMFRCDVKEILTSGIQDLGKFLKEDKHVVMMYKGVPEIVKITAKGDQPYIPNYRKKRNTSNGFVDMMHNHEHLQDMILDSMNTSELSRVHLFKNQIVKSDKILLDHGIDEFFQRLHLEKYGIIKEEEVQEYLKK